MKDIPFLYGELNKQVEYLKYKFKSTDKSATITQDDKNNIIDISINFPKVEIPEIEIPEVDTQKIVTLKQIKKDQTEQNPNIKYYRLYAFNKDTNNYDIEIGDEIIIDTTIKKIPTSALVDYETIIDENGNEIQIPIESILDGNKGGVY